MAPFSRGDLEALLRERPGPCVSIFLPTEKAGRETRQNPIRFENLLREAANRLAERGEDADALLEEPRKWVGDWDFWQHQDEGLAVFVAPGHTGCHRVPLRLEPEVHVASRFHTKPLYPLVETAGRHFYVLALSGNQVRVLRVGETVERVEPEGMPRSLEEALRFDDPERQVQVHTLGGAEVGGAGSVLYHGQGSAGDQERQKVDLLRFCQQIDRALHPVLAAERPPVVLASVEELWSLYREANRSARVLKETLPGNPEPLSDEELAARARQIAEPCLTDREEAVAEYRRLAHTERASDRPEEVLPAALEGRVGRLLAAEDATVWGTLEADAEKGPRVQLGEAGPGEAEDVVDRAAAETWRRRGEVYVLPSERMPDGAPLAAVFRY